MQVNAIIIDSIVKLGDVAAGGHHFPMPLHRLIWLWSPCGDIKLHGHIHDDGASAAVDAASSRIRPSRALLINNGHTRRIISTPRALASVGLARFQRWRPITPLPTLNSTIIVEASSHHSLADEAIIDEVLGHPRQPPTTPRSYLYPREGWRRYCSGEGLRFTAIAKILPKNPRVFMTPTRIAGSTSF